MIRAVFFDLDGTLADSGDAWNTGLQSSFDMFEGETNSRECGRKRIRDC